MALADLPTTGTPNFETNMPDTLHTWRDAIDLKSTYNHDHPGTSLSIHSIAADRTDLGNGPRDGAFGSTTNDHKGHLWSETRNRQVQQQPNQSNNDGRRH